MERTADHESFTLNLVINLVVAHIRTFSRLSQPDNMFEYYDSRTKFSIV
jgi:hypothetical protein